MFYGCDSLKSVDLTSFKLLPLNNLTNLFNGCKELTSINISYISNIPISNYRSCFENCSSLQILDLSGLTFSEPEEDQSNPIDYSAIFKNVIHLKYLILMGSSFTNELKGHIPRNNLIVCQDGNIRILEDDHVTNKCCDLNEDLEKCHASNYIVVYYDNDFVSKYLGTGLIYKKVNYSENISFLSLNDVEAQKNRKIIIKGGSKLEIFFSSPLTSLDNFFDLDNVNYAANIMSVDFSHLDVSNLNSINYLFNKCNSLKSVNFSNFNKAAITNMEGAFVECKNLKSFDLSNINTSSLTNMKNAFYGCSSLKAFYMAGLDLSKVEDAENILSVPDDETGDNTLKIKYLDIMNSTVSDNLKETLLKSNNKLIICENDGYLAKEKTQYTDFCCDFNVETEKCSSSNYIIIYYPNDVIDTIYKFALTDNYKAQIAFIINGDMIATSNDLPININQNNFQIEIHLNSSITSLESFFEGMENIISVDLSHLDSSNITSVKKMFNKCTSLKSIEFPNINTEKIIDMSSMFEGCSNLNLINLSNFNTDNVINMSSIFSGCSSLTFLDISSFNMKKVSNTKDMFKGIEKLEYINLYGIQNFDKNIIEDNLNKINKLTVCQKENIITNEKAVKECCFFNTTIMQCQKKIINIITLYYEKVKYSYGFIEPRQEGIMPSRESVDFIIYNGQKIKPNKGFTLESRSKIDVYFSSFEIDLIDFFDTKKDPKLKKLISIDLSHFYSSKITNMENFTKFELLESINLSNLNASQVTDMHSMFQGSTSLKSVDLHGLIATSVTDMHSMFQGCTSLKSIDLQGLLAPSVSDMHSMFYECISLESINLTNLNISQVSIIHSIFHGCSSLKSIDLHYLITSLVTNMYSIFNGCTSLESINLSNWDTSNVVNMSEMFSACSSIKYIDLSHFDTSSVTDMNSMFYKCSSLESINLSNWDT